MDNKSKQQLLIKIHDLSPSILPNAPPTSPETTKAHKQSSLLLSSSPFSNHVPVHLSSRIMDARKTSHGLNGNRDHRGTQQKWPFSNELRTVFGAAALPKDQSFTDFEFPPWHEHKTSEITLGSGGGGNQRVGKGSVGWGRGAPSLNELQICPT